MLVIFASMLVLVSSKMLPPDMERCSISDPQISQCLKEKVPKAIAILRNGNKNLNVPNLEPISIPKIDLGESGHSSSFSLHQIYEDFKLFGTTYEEIVESKANLSDDLCFWNFTCSIPELKMVSKYQMKGNILVFPVNGIGDCDNVLYDVKSVYTIKCEKYYKKNKNKHIRITDLQFRNYPKRVVYNFKNLFNGNKQLSEELLKTINENALEVYSDAGAHVDAAFSIIFKEIMNQLFSAVPEKDLFLP